MSIQNAYVNICSSYIVLTLSYVYVYSKKIFYNALVHQAYIWNSGPSIDNVTSNRACTVAVCYSWIILWWFDKTSTNVRQILTSMDYVSVSSKNLHHLNILSLVLSPRNKLNTTLKINKYVPIRVFTFSSFEMSRWKYIDSYLNLWKNVDCTILLSMSKIISSPLSAANWNKGCFKVNRVAYVVETFNQLPLTRRHINVVWKSI